MNSHYILWPVLAQVFLTLAMFILLGMRKVKAVKAGEVNRQQAALNNQVWPDAVVKVSNNIANQFEAPILFFVLCLTLHSINAADLVAVSLAWLFALIRYVHAFVHTGSNYVPTRFRVFMLGCLVLIALLVLVAWRLATGSVTG